MHVSDYQNNKLNKLWSAIGTVVSRGLENGRREFIRSTKIGRYRIEISGLRNKIETLYKELGRELYCLWQAQQVPIPQLENVFKQINALEAEIREKQALIEAIVQERGDQIADADRLGASKTSPAKEIASEMEE